MMPRVKRVAGLLRIIEAFLLPAVFSALVVQPGCSSRPGPGLANPAAQDILEKAMTLDSGRKLRYSLILPSAMESRGAVPLVVALHYGGEVVPYYGKGILVDLVFPAWRDLGAVFVAPDCPGRGWTDDLSEKAVLSLIEKLRKEYQIDGRRIVLVGYSLGAIGTWTLAAGHPGLFSAAVPISGIPSKPPVSSGTETPFYVIHSRSDEVFPARAVVEFVQACRSRGLRVRLEMEEGLGHYGFGQFVPALSRASAWLREIWRATSSSGPLQ